MTISTANLDQGSDSPRLARVQLKEAVDLLNRYDDSDGSSLVGFIQSGTGAVATTVQTVLRESVSITRYMTPAQIADAQARTYTFDMSSAVQAAIDANPGKPLHAPSGSYKFLTGITYDTTGLGIVDGIKIIGDGNDKTIFDNRTGGALFTCSSGTSLSDYQENCELSHLTIDNTTAVASTIGWKLSGCRRPRSRGLIVTNQASHGILLDSTSGDGTSVIHIDFKGFDINTNGGSGIYAKGSANGVNAGIDLRSGRIIGNTGGGVLLESVTQCEIALCAVAQNGSFGVKVTRATGGSYSRNVKLFNNEYDTNGTDHVIFDYAVNCSSEHEYHVLNTGSFAVANGVSITANALGIQVKQAMPRLAALYSGFTMFNVASAGATSDIVIEDTNWSSWVASGNTKYANSNVYAIIRDGNVYTSPTRLINYDTAFVPTVSAAVNFTGTPTMTNITVRRFNNLVTIEGQANGTVTATGGASITFDLPINTAAASSYACGRAADTGGYAIGAVIDPAAGSSNTAQIIFQNITLGARVINFSYTYAC